MTSGNTISSLSIQKFSFDMFVPNPSILIVGMRCSGKSLVIREILKHYSDIPNKHVISRMEEDEPFYKTIPLDLYIHNSYNAEILSDLIYQQKKVNTKCCIVLDDCLSHNTLNKDNILQDVLINGRHANIINVVAVQLPMLTPPHVRSSFDYVFLFAEDYSTFLKHIYDYYAGMFDTFDMFKHFFYELTRDYSCMVIVSGGNKGDLTKQIYWYRVPTTM